jgi:hypothetical protein
MGKVAFQTCLLENVSLFVLVCTRDASGVGVMPIRPLLQDGVFSPEDITALATAFEDTLSALGLVDRNDPAVLMVAKRIIKMARQGERNPTRLRNSVVSQFQARSR